MPESYSKQLCLFSIAIYIDDRQAISLICDMNALTAYQKSKYQNLFLLYKAHTGASPSIFLNRFSKIVHKYLTFNDTI